jgi:Uma2 family endonuclease
VTASALAKSFPVYSIETYLDLEANATNRHEYSHGHIYAMAGNELSHDTIKMAVTLLFGSKLSASSCFMTSSDFKVATPNNAAVFYPDLAVHCHPRPTDKTTILSAPSLVVEILSPSTRRYDLTAKRKEYFRIPSLRHYLLIDSETLSVLLYTRDSNQTWPKDPLTFTDPKSLIPLTALKIKVKLKDLYHQTDLL